MSDDYKKGYRDGYRDGLADSSNNVIAYTACAVCGLRIDKPMGRVCYHTNCPVRVST